MASVGLCFVDWCCCALFTGFVMQSVSSSSWVNNTNSSKYDGESGDFETMDHINHPRYKQVSSSVEWYLEEPPAYNKDQYTGGHTTLSPPT